MSRNSENPSWLQWPDMSTSNISCPRMQVKFQGRRGRSKWRFL